MKTRVVVEQLFGILKSRFRCLHKSGGALQYAPEKVAKIAAACMLLHNRCRLRNIPDPTDRIPAMELLEADAAQHNPAPAAGPSGQSLRAEGVQVRNAIAATFVQ